MSFNLFIQRGKSLSKALKIVFLPFIGPYPTLEQYGQNKSKPFMD